MIIIIVFCFIVCDFSMVFWKLVRYRLNRKYGWNFIGFFSKVYKYGELYGVELVLYIEYKEKEGFVFYEMDGYFCYIFIDEKVRSFLSGVCIGLILLC